jgi:CheY-like chemotaxis protein
MTNASAAPRLLVVEDEYLIRMLLEDMLDDLGYGIVAANP